MFLTILHLYQWWQEQSLGNLDEKLQSFYENHVQIHNSVMSYSTLVMKSVTVALQNHLQKKWPMYPVGSFYLSGSVADGLKVCEPDEFDVLVPIVMPTAGPWCVKHIPAPELATFQVKNPNVAIKNYWLQLLVHEKLYYDDKEIRHVKYVSPEKIAKKLEELIFSAKDDASFKESLHSSVLSIEKGKSHEFTYGPAADIKVTYMDFHGNEKVMSIDFVGFVKLGVRKEEHVVNPYYTVAEYISTGCGGKWSEAYADPTVFWRRSYSNTENRLIEKSGMKVKKALMIYKALLLKNKHLRNDIVSSYYIKNIAFILAFEGLVEVVAKSRALDCTDREDVLNTKIVENTSLSHWTSQRLSLQFIVMTKYLYEFVDNGKMPWAFEPRVFLHFDTRDQKKSNRVNIRQLRGAMKEYLREIVEEEKWVKLIEDSCSGF